jgi:hypothetical protein
MMKMKLLATGMVLIVGIASVGGYSWAKGFLSAHKPESHAAKHFDSLADLALIAMEKRAGELKISGVAVVAYAEGVSIQGWSSKMLVVGRMKDAPTAGNNGNNLLGIAYAKAAEMADTLVDSGTSSRPPMTGEFGWQGGVIARTKTGYVIAAFSGGKSEDDKAVSKSGIAVLKDL